MANNSGNPVQSGPRPWRRDLQCQARSSQVRLPSYYLNLSPSKLESPPRHFTPTQTGYRQAQVGVLCRGGSGSPPPQDPYSQPLRGPEGPPPTPQNIHGVVFGGGRWHRVDRSQGPGAGRNEDARRRDTCSLPIDTFSCPWPPTPISTGFPWPQAQVPPLGLH